MWIKRTKRSYNLKRSRRPFSRRNRYGKFTRRKVASRNTVHYFKRKSFAAIVIGTSGAPDKFGTAAYTLNGTQNPSEFTALFDRYKIKAVKTEFVFQGPLASAVSVTTPHPTVYTLIDYNDATTPTSVQGILEYGKTRMHVLGPNRTSCSVYFRPKLLVGAIDASTGNLAGMYNPSSEPWISTANTYAQHYGLKYAIQGLAENYDVNIFHTYYLAFRDSK